MAITQKLQFGKPLPIVKLLSAFQRFPVIVNKEENSKKQTCFYNLSQSCSAIQVIMRCNSMQIAV